MGSVSRAQEAFPWKSGDMLAYEIHWGLLVAAEATFHGEKKPGGWSLTLDLKSRGVVETTFPIRSTFTSLSDPEIRRSLAFSEDRKEGEDREKNTISRDYLKKESTYRDLLKNESKVLPLKEESVQDMISMLFCIRQHPWEKEPVWTFVLQDRLKIKYGKARLAGREQIRDAAGELRDIFLIEAVELNKKGEPKNNGWLRIWITADKERLPLKARIKFKYGSFSIRLKAPEDPVKSPAL